MIGLLLSRLAPLKYWALLLLLAALAAFVWRWDAHRLAEAFEAGYAKGHAEFIALRDEMTRRALEAQEIARAEEARRAAAQKEIEDAHQAALQAGVVEQACKA